MWTLAAIALLVVEMLTPGTFFWIFFGAGALVLALISAIWPELPVAAQGLLFAGFSLVSLGLFRKPLLRMLNRDTPPRASSDLVGETAFALEEIPAGAIGRAELRGTAWTATNSGDLPIHRSSRCKVERVEGLMLWIRSRP